jgi:hypothetical protein
MNPKLLRAVSFVSGSSAATLIIPLKKFPEIPDKVINIVMHCEVSIEIEGFTASLLFSRFTRLPRCTRHTRLARPSDTPDWSDLQTHQTHQIGQTLRDTRHTRLARPSDTPETPD